MKNTRLLLTCLIIISSLFFSFSSERNEDFYVINAPNALNYQIAKWYNNKNSAVSITFDDNTPTQFTLAKPILDRLNMNATFYITTDLANAEIWGDIKDAYAQGHEIGSHTVSHPDLTSLSDAQIKHELEESKRLILQNVPSDEYLTVAWPYGEENSKVRSIATSLNYIGGRLAGGGITPSNPINESGFMYRIRSYVIENTSLSAFNSELNSVAAQGNWLVFLYHGIEGNGWKPTPVNDFEQQMNALSGKQDQIWVAPFKDVYKYYNQRLSASLVEKSITDSQITLQLSDNLTDGIYNVPLTVNLELADGRSIQQATQNGKSIEFYQTGNILTFNAIPDAGDILLTCNDCSGAIDNNNSVSGFSGLHFSDDEINVWRKRAGLDPGTVMYNNSGDVTVNSPNDWQRILADALTAVSNSANDRFTNYDTSQGLDKPITELNTSGIPKSWPERVPYIDDKEPRPGINNKDYGALSVLHAGYVYLMIGGDNGSILGKKGSEFANAVKTELLWYSQNQWLDFTNRNRWSVSKPFFDRNPGFFIACWLNTMLNAYDYTKNSSVYSAAEKQKIDAWIFEASRFYNDMMLKVMNGLFNGYSNGNYGNVPTGGWIDRNIGSAWDGSQYLSYGLNEYFSNRSAATWRFIMRAGLFFKEHPTYNSIAKNQVKAAHQWCKTWVTFGTFSDGTFTDFHRGKSNDPQKGLFYASIAIGAIIDLVDAYERHMMNEADFESLYEWQLQPGTAEYNQFFPSSTNGRPWRKSIELSQPKGLKTIITTFLKHFDGTFGNTRSLGGFNIDGYSAPSGASVKNVDTDRWMALANMYYKDAYIKSIYTRTKSGIRKYEINPTRAGSYNINNGSWGSVPGSLLMFGQMENVAWPYEDNKSNQNITFSAINDRFISDGSFELTAVASSGLTVNFEIVNGPAYINGNIISFTGAGDVTVKAYQSGNDDFKAVATTQSFTVKKKLTIDDIEDQIMIGGNEIELPITIQYGGTDASSINLSFTSNNNAIILDENITSTGNGLTRILKIKSEEGSEGNVKLTLNATDGVAVADPISFNVLVGEFSSSTLRLDAGLESGESFYEGKTFVPMLPYLFEGDARNSFLSTPIANTESDELYQYEIWGNTEVTKFVFPVAQGQYSIHLHFADWHYNNPGDRVMDILLEDEIVLDDFDIISEVGKSAVIIKSFDKVIMDGSVDLEIRNIKGYSKISAVEILPIVEEHLDVEQPDALNQVIDFGSLGTINLTDSPIQLVAFSSSGLPVSFELISGPAELNGDKLTLTDLGVVTIKASQAGDESYLPADDVLRTFRVTEKITMPKLSDHIIKQNETLGPISLGLSYSGDVNNLNISVESKNKELIPDENIIVQKSGNDFEIIITPGKDLIGVSKITVDVSDNNYAVVKREFNVLVEENIFTASALRLDAGIIEGETSYEGKTFEPLLPYVVSGTSYSTYAYWVTDVLNTENDGLYQTELWWETDSTLNFEFPIDPGEYTVHLHFIDLYSSSNGDKLVDAFIQNKQVLNNYDIIQEVGNEIAVIKSFDVTIATGNLELSFYGVNGFNQISGIEILPKGEEPLQLIAGANVVNNIPVINDVEEPLIQEGATMSVDVLATDADGDSLSLMVENLPEFVTFIDNGNGIGSLTVSPGLGDEGVYDLILVANDNQGGESKLAFNIIVVDNPIELKISSFTLVDGDTGEDIGTLNDGDTIRYTDIGTKNINIKAEVDASLIDKVSFYINQLNTIAEAVPFNLFNSSSDSIFNQSEILISAGGLNILEAIPYKTLINDGSGESKSYSGIKSEIKFYLDTDYPELEVEVYPNPSEKMFNFTINQWSRSGMYYSLYDVMGKLYVNGEIDISKKLSLNMDDKVYESGIYFFKIYSADGSLSSVKRISKL